jgi:ADP-ribose pyrophosphatase YjhB (NUDIX family)
VTVDSVLFTLHEQALRVLLVKRASHPQQGRWGLPGGFIDMEKDESTRATALRKLTEKTGVSLPGWSNWIRFPGQNAIPVAGV